MRRVATAFVVLVYLFVAFAPPPPVYSQKLDQTRARFVEGEILVKLRPGLPGDSLEQIADQLMPGRFPQIERLEASGGGDLFHFKFDSRISVQDAIRNTLADPRVEYAEPNYLLRLSETVPNDEFFNLMWGLANNGDNSGSAGADIGATRVWDITQGSQDVVVAVVDTGADLSHPDLSANAWVNPGEVA
ncbi:MAG TPA: hypothetical protein VF131_23300, partial [Blastocatellia bacterium]|nr:hypothetical protein [Blastocatellia bacterium]